MPPDVPLYTIRSARPLDLDRIVDVEVAAASLFRSVGLDEVADGEPTSRAFLVAILEHGRLAVAVDELDRPIGFAQASVLDHAVHLHELSVDPAHGRKGIGAALIGTIETYALETGLSAVTLSTFSDVPWNAPYYARLGFGIVEAEALSPAMHMLRAREREAGLPLERRVFMRKELVMTPPRLTHLDQTGAAQMVDVSEKAVTERTAIAEGAVVMAAATLDLIRSGLAAKGDVIATARIAGIMAAKKTHELIPLCHPIMLAKVSVDIQPDDALPGLRIRATTRVADRTGVEMEALTAVSVACLTIYDMAKAVDRGMSIGPIRLVEKVGGRSGHWRAEP